jgi:hypothetical protein
MDRSIAKCNNAKQPVRKTKQDIGARRLLAEEEVKLATLKKEPGGPNTNHKN